MSQRIAILGAGPTGLEAALAALEKGFEPTVYEAADAPAGHVGEWGHVRLFTPWEMNVSPRAASALARAGKPVPGGAGCPTGAELRRELYFPLAELPELAPRLCLGTRVFAVGRHGLLKNEEIASAERASRPFRLLVGREGRERIDTADVVIDTTGSYALPNSLGDGGIPAPGEAANEPFLRRRIPDFDRERKDWAGRRVLLVGAGHSAGTAARELARLAREAPGTQVIWALRGALPSADGAEEDPLPERARLVREVAALSRGASPALSCKVGVAVESLARDNGSLLVTLRGAGGLETVTVDRVLALTGAVGDHSLYRQLQVHECYATCGPMKLSAALLGAGGGDCLAQVSHGAETLKNPEPGFFILGSKSYGRNNTFLLRIGWQQVDEVMSLL